MSKVNFFTEYLRLALWRACMIFMNMFSQCTFYLPTHSSRKLGVLSDHFNAKMPIQNQTVLIGLDPYFEDIHCDIDILEYKDLSYPQTILSVIEVRCYILGCRLT